MYTRFEVFERGIERAADVIDDGHLAGNTGLWCSCNDIRAPQKYPPGVTRFGLEEF
jgi:hypothetical protein